jgi:hypothetical protein
VEFYRHFPNFVKGDDGKYHILHVNNLEDHWNSADTAYEVSRLHTIFPLAVRASEVLGVDADLRPIWAEIAENLVPLTVERPPRRPALFGAFVAGDDVIQPVGPEPDLKRRFLSFTRLGEFGDTAGSGGAQIFRNRLRLREGPGAPDAEHLGGLLMGVHWTMLSNAAPPHDEPLLQLFDGWPKDWDAAFSLRGPGAFIIRAAQVDGRVPVVEIVSEVGGPCRLMNPWKHAPVSVHRGPTTEEVSGAILELTTSKGETVVLTPRGSAVPPRLELAAR